ncbi:MAG: glutamine-hydrolyzing GMP synthase, partial [Rhodospirillaceae bacterium]|nr:glutamine-hydrolyzing GMP synthase [Rhodospirillaceae bacterium]
MSDRILIIDFGSQVTQLIARRVRESGVYSEVHPFNKVTQQSILDFDPNGIILSGGPASVTDIDTPRAPDEIFDMDLPILGICYGQQTMVEQMGGKVAGSEEKEFGRAIVTVTDDCELFHGVWDVGNEEQVWMSHGDRVEMLPDGFRIVGTSENAPYAAIAHDEKKFYAVQFHPEVVHTPHGAQLLENFTHRVAGCGGDWTMAAFKEQEIAKVREQVGDGKVICGLSGGVDSSVVAVLLHEAIGDQLTCVFVDTGMMRMDEADEVVSLFRDHYNFHLVHVDASDLFLGKLDGVSDPEEKRKIIGSTFIDVFEEEANKIGGADFLAQGTLYPDVIESVSFAGGPSVT